MAEPEFETYLTKKNPDADDWLEFNKDYFATLNNEKTENNPRYAPFVDVDIIANQAGLSIEEYYQTIKTRVGVLAKATIELVHSDMDDAWHIIIAETEDFPTMED